MTKKLTLVCFLLFMVTTTGFAANLVLDNQTPYPMKHQKTKIAIQWANSTQEMNDADRALIEGSKINLPSLQMITQQGKIQVNSPKKAEFFRVLVWSQGNEAPDFHTNWVEITPNKTYVLDEDHLVPVALMSGFGC